MKKKSIISSFNSYTASLPWQEKPMPVLFIGHGSPMNGIQDNEFSTRWKVMGHPYPSTCIGSLCTLVIQWYPHYSHGFPTNHP